MSVSAPDFSELRALDAAVNDEALSVDLSDGRTIHVPIAWFPRLLNGTGGGINWPSLEEDISVESILVGRPSQESPSSLKRWLVGRKRDQGAS